MKAASIALMLSALLLAGCGGSSFIGTCMAQPIGQTEEGIAVLRVGCKGDK